MNYFKRSQELAEEQIQDRRHLHQHPEVGMDLPNTTDYVFQRLAELGYEPERIVDSGVVATIGPKEGKTILLRADMDALPMKEESGLEFSSENDYAHACGHDLHTSMLLSAARMLKENEENLKGTVKLMFQPGEEIFQGAKAMIEAGILENPKVDVALGYHVGAGKMPLGIHMYNNESTMMFSNSAFKIEISGKGGHGAYPHFSVDPINIGVHIHLALQELIAREVDPSIPTVLTIGKFIAGEANNVIPSDATLEGTIRTTDNDTKDFLVKRLEQIAKNVAETYRGEAAVEIVADCPPLINHPEFTDEILSYMKELDVPNQYAHGGIQASASEDFAYILQHVPGTYMYLSAGFPDRDDSYSAHHPKVKFNEGVMPIGAAYLAHSATKWLEEHQEGDLNYGE